MIELYGRTYASNNKQVLDTLFDPINGRTANGYYKETDSGVMLYDLQGKARAFMRNDGFGPVTVSETKQGTRYMFGLCSVDADWLGFRRHDKI